MEEKKSVKISLSTVLFFIAILVIAFLSYYIYIEKTNHNKQLADLEANTDNMQEIINNLQIEIDNIRNNSSISDSNVDTDKLYLAKYNGMNISDLDTDLSDEERALAIKIFEGERE